MSIVMVDLQNHILTVIEICTAQTGLTILAVTLTPTGIMITMVVLTILTATLMRVALYIILTVIEICTAQTGMVMPVHIVILLIMIMAGCAQCILINTLMLVIQQHKSIP